VYVDADWLEPEEAAILEVLIDARIKRENDVPESERKPVDRPEAYAFPIGIDDAGDPFPLPPRPDVETDA
jgi:hypothetical protein